MTGHEIICTRCGEKINYTKELKSPVTAHLIRCKRANNYKYSKFCRICGQVGLFLNYELRKKSYLQELKIKHSIDKSLQEFRIY